MDATSVTSPSIPLTTIFSAPTSCAAHWTYENSKYNGFSHGLLIQNAINATLDTDCFPTSFSNYGRLSTGVVYMPGRCPAGYDALNLRFTDYGPGTATCCPSSFGIYYSYSIITAGPEVDSQVDFAGCTSVFAKGSTTVVPARNGDNSLKPSDTVTGPLTMWAQQIVVAAPNTDTALFQWSSAPSPTLPSVSLPSISIVPTVTRTTSAQASVTALPSTQDNDSKSEGLSLGAQAGIAIGAVIGVVALLGLILFFIRRRTQQERSIEGKAPGQAYEQMRGAYRDDRIGHDSATSSIPMTGYGGHAI